MGRRPLLVFHMDAEVRRAPGTGPLDLQAEPASCLLAGPGLRYLDCVHIVKFAVWTHSCFLWSFKDSLLSC